MFKFNFKKYSLIFTISSVLILGGCGGSSSNDDKPTLAILGKAIDGYISGANVTIKNKDTNEIIDSIKTDTNGNFTFHKPDGVNIIIDISGGTDTSSGEPFVGSMQKIVSKTENIKKVNVTPLSSLVVQLVQSGEIENIENAKDTVAKALNIDLTALNSDPIDVLKKGTNEEKTNAANMMKQIAKIHKFAELVSTVSSNSSKAYNDIYKVISKKLTKNSISTVLLDDIMDAPNTNSLIDDIALESAVNQLEKDKFLALKDLTKNTIKVLDKIDVDELKNTDTSKVTEQLSSNAKAIEVLIIPLKSKLSELQKATSISEINEKKINAHKIVKATIAIGGIKAIATARKNNENNISTSDFAKIFLNDEKVEEKSNTYDNAINSGITTEEIITENEDNNETNVSVKYFGNLKGSIYKETTGDALRSGSEQGISNVTVIINDNLSTKEVITDSNGYFSLNDVTEGNVSIIIKRADADMPDGAKGKEKYIVTVKKDILNNIGDFGFLIEDVEAIDPSDIATCENPISFTWYGSTVSNSTKTSWTNMLSNKIKNVLIKDYNITLTLIDTNSKFNDNNITGGGTNGVFGSPYLTLYMGDDNDKNSSSLQKGDKIELRVDFNDSVILDNWLFKDIDSGDIRNGESGWDWQDAVKITGYDENNHKVNMSINLSQTTNLKIVDGIVSTDGNITTGSGTDTTDAKGYASWSSNGKAIKYMIVEFSSGNDILHPTRTAVAASGFAFCPVPDTAPPTLTTTPKTTAEDYIEVEVNGKAGKNVFVNGEDTFEVLNGNGKATIELKVLGNNGKRNFKIYLADDENGTNKSDALTLEIIKNAIPILTEFSITIDENTSKGTVLHTLNISNDISNNLTFFIGDHSNVHEMDLENPDLSLASKTSDFMINNKGQLILNKNLDYETQKTYRLAISATNDAGTSELINATIYINDIIDTKPVIENLNLSIAENTDLNSSIGDINISIGDSKIISYELNDTTNFMINKSGKIILVNKNLDYEKTKNYNLTVRAINSAGISNEANITINISNIIDTKPVLDNFSTTIEEDIKIGTKIGTINVLNSGDSDISSFDLNDSKNFIINEYGEIFTNTSIDYETKNIYLLKATATNQAGVSNVISVNIIINDVKEGDISGTLYKETTNDTSRSGTEQGIKNVTVSITDSSGITKSTVTNNHGDFNITNLVAGNAILKVDLLDPDMDENLTGNSVKNIMIVSNANTNIGNIGFSAVSTLAIDPSSIATCQNPISFTWDGSTVQNSSKTVWKDINDTSLIENIGGYQVRLTLSDISGKFNSIDAGTSGVFGQPYLTLYMGDDSKTLNKGDEVQLIVDFNDSIILDNWLFRDIDSGNIRNGENGWDWQDAVKIIGYDTYGNEIPLTVTLSETTDLQNDNGEIRTQDSIITGSGTDTTDPKGHARWSSNGKAIKYMIVQFKSGPAINNPTRTAVAASGFSFCPINKTTAPTLTSTPSVTIDDNITVEINGNEGSEIYVNGVSSNIIINSSKKTSLTLDTSGEKGIKSFDITLLKDGIQSKELHLQITKYKTGIVTGNIYKETTGDTKRSGTELGISNVDIILTDIAGYTHKAVSDENGYFIFENVAEGNATLSIDTLDPDLSENLNGTSIYNFIVIKNNTLNIGDLRFVGIDAKAIDPSSTATCNNPISFTWDGSTVDGSSKTIWEDMNTSTTKDVNISGVNVKFTLNDINGKFNSKDAGTANEDNSSISHGVFGAPYLTLYMGNDKSSLNKNDKIELRVDFNSSVILDNWLFRDIDSGDIRNGESGWDWQDALKITGYDKYDNIVPMNIILSETTNLQNVDGQIRTHDTIKTGTGTDTTDPKGHARWSSNGKAIKYMIIEFSSGEAIENPTRTAVAASGFSFCKSKVEDEVILNNSVPLLANFTKSIDENASIGTVVGNVTVINDGNETITSFELNDTNNFDINSSGTIITKTLLDYETNTQYNLSVIATNSIGKSLKKDVNIIINNIADIAPTISGFNTSIDENVISETTIGSIDVVNSGDSAIVLFEINDTSNFSINNNGVITSAVSFNYENKHSYIIEVNASNEYGVSNTVEVNVSINDINESIIPKGTLEAALKDGNVSQVPGNTNQEKALLIYDEMKKVSQEKENICKETMDYIFKDGYNQVQLSGTTSNYSKSTNRTNQAFILSKDKNTVYGWIGTTSNDTRFAYVGINTFDVKKATPYPELDNSILQTFKWILKLTKDEDIKSKNLTFLFGDKGTRNNINNWLTNSNINTNWTLTYDSSLLENGGYDIFISKPDNKEQILKSLALNKPIYMFTNGSFSDKKDLLPTFGLKAELTAKVVLINDYDDKYDICKKDINIGILHIVDNIVNNKLDFQYNDEVCPSAGGQIRCGDKDLLNFNGKTLAEEFRYSAKQLKKVLVEFDKNDQDLFTLGEEENFYKLNLLLGDLFRKDITYPMDKIETPEQEFYKAYFADFAVSYARDTNFLQKDLGTFISQEDNMSLESEKIKRIQKAQTLSSVEGEDKNISIDQVTTNNWTTSTFFAKPGSSIIVRRTDDKDVTVQVKFNMHRSGSTRIWNPYKYERPRFMQSNPIEIKKGKDYIISTPYGGPIYIYTNGIDDVDSPYTLETISLEFKNVLEHPTLTSFDESSINTYIAELKQSNSLFHWTDIKTPFIEIHSMKSMMKEALSPDYGYFPYNNNYTLFLGDIEKYTVKAIYNLAGFKDDILTRNDDVLATCTEFGLMCDDKIHNKPATQHINVDIFTDCGSACSGNPFDTSKPINPTAWLEGHEIGHNLQRNRFNMYDSFGKSTEVSNNIFPLYVSWRYIVDHNVTVHPHDVGVRHEDAYETITKALRDKIEAKDVGYLHPLWSSDKSGERVSFYAHLVYNEQSWDIYTKLYLFERYFNYMSSRPIRWTDEVKNRLGFSTYTQEEAKNIKGNDFLPIALSKLTKKDYREFFRVWGVDVNQKAQSQIELNGYPSLEPVFYFEKNKRIHNFLPKYNIPIDDKPVLNLSIDKLCSNDNYINCSVNTSSLGLSNVYFKARIDQNQTIDSSTEKTMILNSIDNLGNNLDLNISAIQDGNTLYVYVKNSNNALDENRTYGSKYPFFAFDAYDKTTNKYVAHIKLSMNKIKRPRVVDFSGEKLVLPFSRISTGTYFLATNENEGPIIHTKSSNTDTQLTAQVSCDGANKVPMKLFARKNSAGSTDEFGYDTKKGKKKYLSINSTATYKDRDNALILFPFDKSKNTELSGTCVGSLVLEARDSNVKKTLRENIEIKININTSNY